MRFSQSQKKAWHTVITELLLLSVAFKGMKTEDISLLKALL